MVVFALSREHQVPRHRKDDLRISVVKKSGKSFTVDERLYNQAVKPPSDEFSGWDDSKFTIGGLLALATPLFLLGLIGLVLYSLFG